MKVDETHRDRDIASLHMYESMSVYLKITTPGDITKYLKDVASSASFYMGWGMTPDDWLLKEASRLYARWFNQPTGL
jgi:hypothetical protein